MGRRGTILRGLFAASVALNFLAGCHGTLDVTVENQLADPVRVDHDNGTEYWRSSPEVETWNIPAGARRTFQIHNRPPQFIGDSGDDEPRLRITPLVTGPAPQSTWRVEFLRPGPFALAVRGDSDNLVFERVQRVGETPRDNRYRLRVERIAPKEAPSAAQ